MRSRLLLLVLALGGVAGCGAGSYGMREAERTRTYAAPFDTVWEQTLRVLPELRWTVVDRSKADGRIEAKTGFKMTAYKGYTVIILISKLSEATTRVEVGAEPSLEGQYMDTGGSKKRVRELLAKLDTVF